MCQDKKPKAASNDEVWEIHSTEGDNASDSECESDAGQRAPPPPQRAAAPPASQRLLAASAEAAPQRAELPLPGSHGAKPLQNAPPSPKVLPSFANLRATPAQQMAQRVTANAQTGGLMTLVSHLRADNTRLREALVAAQRECEALVAAQQRQAASAAEQQASVPSVDFGHLLELVRDFGADGLGGCDEDYFAEDSPSGGMVQVFSMVDSPRGEAGQSEEVEQLRDELEDSRLEIAQLRAELAARGGCAAAARGLYGVAVQA